MTTILVVDDDLAVRDSLDMILSYENYEVYKASDAKEALEQLKKYHEEIELALLDIKMPGMDGLELLERMKQLYPEIVVIMISGNADIAHAVQATKKGAYDFLEKPLDQNRILITIQNALKSRKLAEQNVVLRKIVSQDRQLLGISKPMTEIFHAIKRVAAKDANVLITGENGTGKELVARAIHENSGRCESAFVDVNCAAIPDSLIESELFGHEKGSFTHAYERHKGKFEQADNGTLFLDEIGDMSPAAQAKVLRVLEENKVERVGGTQTIKVNVRVIAATNKDLPTLCQDATFRLDLYHRLNVIPIHIPPLRERLEDIPLLVNHFLIYFAQKYSSTVKKISPDAVKELQKYRWPGNIRELRNLMERLVILTDADVIQSQQVHDYLPTPNTQIDDVMGTLSTFEDFKRESEKLFLLKKLVENGWNIKKTAEDLEMQRSNLYKKIEKYGLKPNP